MGPSSSGPGRPLAEINVTPMVDVMLVLLIIFMVTAPLIQQGVQVKLPQASAASLDVQNDPLVVTLTRERKLFFGEVELPLAQLRDRVLGNLKLREDKQVVLHADRDLAYGVVMDVIAALKEAGVDGVGLVTDPLAPRTP